jgi:hypothetical protein
MLNSKHIERKLYHFTESRKAQELRPQENLEAEVKGSTGNRRNMGKWISSKSSRAQAPT